MKYEEYTTNGHGHGRGPAEIDSDLSAIRSEMSETLHLLEDKFSPRALLEQLISGARGASHGSSDFVGNLGATIRDNPVPMLLLASGVVSLLAADRTGGGRATEGKAGSIKSRARDVADTAGERARDLRERAGEQASDLGERGRELRAHAHETGTAAREHVRDAMHHTRERGSRAIQDEPLVIVGLGLAIGAMLGAGMPVSERERRMLGHEGEGLIRRGETAIGRAKQAVQQGVERATEVATQQRTPAAGPQRAPEKDAPVVLGASASSSVLVEVPPEVDDSEVAGERPGGIGNR